MDNKLTKKRLSDYLSYEWILMIIVVAALIVVWELVYTLSAVRLTSGQQFRYYYDENIYSGNDANFYDLLEGENGEKTFSYDVLSAGYEALNPQYNVLSVRLSVYEGDAIFTDSTEDENGSSRMKNTVDGYSMYTFTHLEEDGINYLSSFLKDEYAGLSFAEKKVKVYDYNNLDESKIDAHFLDRMKGDNRFRSAEEKEDGKVLERGRIKKLCTEMEKFGYLLSVGDEKGLFMRYTKYELAYANAEDKNKSDYEAAIEREKEAGRENAIYGLRLDKLTGGRSVSEYFRVKEKDSADGVTLALFDFYDVKDAKLYDLQFESVSFLNKIVEEFSDVYSSFGK